jgi:hypothetical protein
MTLAEAQAGLLATTRDIIACKKMGRRQYGTSHRAQDTRWPESELTKLRVLKAQAKAFRVVIEQTRAYRMPPGVCAFCDEHATDQMMPGHSASDLCESGQRNHCTCDICF